MFLRFDEYLILIIISNVLSYLLPILAIPHFIQFSFQNCYKIAIQPLDMRLYIDDYFLSLFSLVEPFRNILSLFNENFLALLHLALNHFPFFSKVSERGVQLHKKSLRVTVLKMLTGDEHRARFRLFFVFFFIVLLEFVN